MTLKVAKDKGRMSPLGGLTRNFFGDEVWILKATGEVGFRERSRTVARHLQLSANSMRTSAGSHTSTSASSIYQSSILCPGLGLGLVVGE